MTGSRDVAGLVLAIPACFGGGARELRGFNAAITIRIGFQRMSNITRAQQGNVKVDKTFA
jgi:hypothetical protein